MPVELSSAMSEPGQPAVAGGALGDTADGGVLRIGSTSGARHPTSLRDAVWTIVGDSTGMTDTGHAATVRWARSLLGLDNAEKPYVPARRRTGAHVHGYTKDATGLWFCSGCREVFVGRTPDGFQHAKPGRLITVAGGVRHPWRALWDEDDPNRPCWTCGNPPDHRFPDGSPAYPCLHDPVWLGSEEAVL